MPATPAGARALDDSGAGTPAGTGGEAVDPGGLESKPSAEALARAEAAAGAPEGRTEAETEAGADTTAAGSDADSDLDDALMQDMFGDEDPELDQLHAAATRPKGEAGSGGDQKLMKTKSGRWEMLRRHNQSGRIARLLPRLSC